jgi:hypothetical protein
VTGAEHARRAECDTGAVPWRHWGPYLAERAWGTVREDYSESGASWDYFPHDHSRSRTYRWSEDALAGICDDQQLFCFGLAMWNGKDDIIKERIFGLGGPEGNHGEDAKDYWWYLDSTPTHSWMKWRYHYPQAAFPYADLVVTNRSRTRSDPEYNLCDTGVFNDDRYFAVTADFAKINPTDMCVRVTVANRGPEAATLKLLPMLWFRNTWVWEPPGAVPTPVVQGLAASDGRPARLVADHEKLGRIVLTADGAPEPMACDNQTNEKRLTGGPTLSAYPKDGINDHVVNGAATVNPTAAGTKAALCYTLEVPAGGQVEVRLRLTQTDSSAPETAATDAPAADLAAEFDIAMVDREREADEFFAALTPAGASPDEARVIRQSIAGLMWSKQFYHFDVNRWLNGDPVGPPPPDSHKYGRNAHWSHMRCHDVLLVPDPWEYPWYAAWDLAFHAVAIARADPAFAKGQVLMLLDDRYIHRNGALPAYEWAFGDVNPPVQAWAVLRVFEMDGAWDFDFLAVALHKLMLNFGWWANRKDRYDSSVFEGGFLGLDNIAPFDRSAPLPVPGELDQADATAWMAAYALHLMSMALILARRDRAYVNMALKFLDHFTAIANALYDHGLWDSYDGAFYDVLRADDGTSIPMAVRSLVGLIPLAATSILQANDLAAFPEVAERLATLTADDPRFAEFLGESPSGNGDRLLSAIGPTRLARVLAPVLDEAAFLSPYGIRSVSAEYRNKPYTVRLGKTDFTVTYDPGDSTDGTFGGNSNWRGPVWFPINYLLIESLRTYGDFLSGGLLVEFPTGSGNKLPLDGVADELARRLVALFLNDEHGKRPCFGELSVFQDHPDWHDLIVFNEYFHGDTGVGLGASHQTGWTALVAELIIGMHHGAS